MFALSFSSVVLIVIIGFVFRKTLRQATDIAPSIASDALTMASVASNYAKDVVYINEAESRLELQQRAKAIADAMANAQDAPINIEQLANRVRNGQ